MSITAKTGGCGCGGGGSGGCGGDCGCGCGGGSMSTTEAFKRPQFFAGQLLTEDDLQALTDYVVGKNRLHNRYLFGDGVVCGLTVTCHPCGGEKVTVAPGYALDCCGNDILVPCKVELDAKSLIRDLRQRQLAGYQCGDPCEKTDGSRRSYGLYLTYTETPDDLVAPYTSGDPCGQQDCQATRIREGYKFELRCDCGGDKRIDVFTRIAACVGDLSSAAAALGRAQANQAMAKELDQGLYQVRSEQPVPFGAQSIATMRESETRLAAFKDAAVPSEDAAVKFTVEERELREKAADYQALMGAMVRFKSQPADAQRALLKDNPELPQLLEKSEATLAESGTTLAALARASVGDPLARARIADNVKLGEAFALGEQPEENLRSVQARMIAYNAPVSTGQLQTMSTNASLLKSWLLERLESSASQTRCDLYERTVAVQIPGVAENSVREDGSVVESSNRASRELARILIEYFVDCVCLALNPVCHECDDNSVLLACLEVDQCEVIDICNMSRRFVLSPTAMRYWLPPLGWIGTLFEKLCCGLDLSRLFERDRQPPPPEGDGVPAPAPAAVALSVESPRRSAMAVAATYVPNMERLVMNAEAATVLERVKLAPSDLKVLGDFSANLALLSKDAAAIRVQPADIRLDAAVAKVAERIRPEIGKAAMESPAVREEIATKTKAEVTAAREAMATELKAEMAKEAEVARAEMAKETEAARTAMREAMATELRAEMAKEAEAARATLREAIAKDVSAAVSKDLAATLKADLAKEMDASIKTSVDSTVKTAVGKELTATKLRTAVRDLAEIKTLTADVKTLSTSVRKLEGGQG